MSKNKVTLETHSVEDTQCFGERLGHVGQSSLLVHYAWH